MAESLYRRLGGYDGILGHINATCDYFKVPSQEKSEVLGDIVE